jgi:hypothetical protein
VLIENVASNPCVGCGPANPIGLKLEFRATADGAASRFVAEPRWQGFPGRLHSAVLYLALIETMNWSLYAATGHMGLPARTGALRMVRRVRVGDVVELAGGVKAAPEGGARAFAEARTPDGEEIGSLDRDYRMVSEAEFLRAMEYDAVPEGYDGLFA